MNINDYRRAMDRIVPDAALKERIMNQKNTKKKYTPARRVFTVALAAALSVTCLATVAFAASPELRTAVLSFFRMEEREQVPNSSAGSDGPDVSNAEIGALVKAQYIKMDSYRYGYSSGLLNDLTWSEDWNTLLDYKFWEVKDNELIPVEVDMQTGVVDITFNGIHYQGDFWWFLRDGHLDFFTGDNRAWGEEGEHAWDWNFSPSPAAPTCCCSVCPQGHRWSTWNILSSITWAPVKLRTCLPVWTPMCWQNPTARSGPTASNWP